MRFKCCKKGCQVVTGLASAEQFPHGERDTFGWNSNVVTWCHLKWWFRKGILKSSENYPAFQAIGGCLRWPGCVAMNIQMAPGRRRSSCKPNMWEKEIRRCSKRVNVGSCGGAGWCCGCCCCCISWVGQDERPRANSGVFSIPSLLLDILLFIPHHAMIVFRILSACQPDTTMFLLIRLVLSLRSNWLT